MDGQSSSQTRQMFDIIRILLPNAIEENYNQQSPTTIQDEVRTSFEDHLQEALKKVYCDCNASQDTVRYEVLTREFYDDEWEYYDYARQHYRDQDQHTNNDCSHLICNFCAIQKYLKFQKYLKEEELEEAGMKVFNENGEIVEILCGPTIIPKHGGKKHRAVFRPASFNYKNPIESPNKKQKSTKNESLLK
jgi:hypothetical protein